MGVGFLSDHTPEDFEFSDTDFGGFILRKNNTVNHSLHELQNVMENT